MLNSLTIVERLYESPRVRVVRAVRRSDQRAVVAKIVASGPQGGAEALTREYGLLERVARFGCAQVPQPVGLVQEDGWLGLLTEDVGAVSLRELTQPARLPLAEIVQLGLEVTRALAAMHQARVVHKDINPNNIVYNRQQGRVQVVDYGIAMAMTGGTRDAASLRVMEGTLAYLSPEQTGRTHHALDHRSDFYSLGVTLYELLAGKVPFNKADTAELIYAILANRPGPLESLAPDAPPGLVAVIARLMEKDPNLRYQSAHGVAVDLEYCFNLIHNQQSLDVFPLASQDRIERFEVPASLYGRSAQQDAALRSFDACRNDGMTRVVWLEGGPGSGKTALAQSLHAPWAARRGWVMPGTFAALQRPTAFAAVGEALGTMLRQLLKEPELVLEPWRRRLAAALGNAGGCLVPLVPHLEQLVGPQPPSVELPLREAENRVLGLLQRCIVLLAKERPLLLVLDGVQWADAGSLKLVQALAQEIHVGAGLTLVLTSRGEVAWDASAVGARGLHLALPPLSLSEVEQLISEATHAEATQVRLLASAVHRQTAGNPRFVRGLLMHLWNQELITYNTRAGVFIWDMQAIERSGVPDSLGDLLSNRIRALPADAVLALTFAACAGNPVRPTLLAQAMGVPAQDMVENLHACRQAGLLVPWDDADADAAVEGPTAYAFAHDHVRQAAYDLLTEGLAQQAHHAIGHALWRALPPTGGDVLAVVYHLNRCLPLCTDVHERQRLAQLNRTAAQAAQHAASPAVARGCLDMAVHLLAEAPNADRDLARQLQLDLAYSESLGGGLEAALGRLRHLAETAQTAFEVAAVQTVRTNVYNAAGRYAEAVQACMDGLQALNYPVHLRSPWRVAWLFIKVIVRAQRTPAAELETAPLCEQPRLRAALALLGAGAGAAYFHDSLTTVNLVLHVTLLSMRYGRGPDTAFAYAMFAALLATLNFYGLARIYGRLARRLAERGEQAHEARVLFSWTGWLGHIEGAPDQLLRESQRALASARDFGDVFYGAANTISVQSFRMLCPRGLDLSDDDDELELPESTPPNQRQTVRLTRQTVRCFNGRTESVTSLADATCTELELQDHPTTVTLFHWRKLMVALVHRDLLGAVTQSELLLARGRLRSLPDGTMGSFALYTAIALSQFALATGARRVLRPAMLRMCLRKLRALVRAAPHLHGGAWDLVHAELAAVRGDVGVATVRYDLACSKLAKSPWCDRRALAFECAGRFYLRRSMLMLAELYLRHSREAYAMWGARIKLAQLDDEMRAVFVDTTGEVPHVSMAALHTTVTAPGAGTGGTPLGLSVDVPALMQVSRAISGEVQLDKLVERVLDGLLKCTGATRAVLLFPQDRGFRVVADSAAHTQPNLGLPNQVFQFVARSSQPLVMHELQSAEIDDPYFGATSAKAIVCAPIMRQDLLRGLVYLESDINANAFEAQQISVIEVLAAQAAIALENAETYAHLEREVAKRTLEVKTAHARLVQVERESTEMQMAGGFAHEMRNALSAARMCLEVLLRAAQVPRDEPTLRDNVRRALATLGNHADPAVRAAAQVLAESHEETYELLENIRLGVDHGMDITRSILEYAHVGHIVVGDDSVTVDRVVQRVIGDLHLDPSIRIDTNIPGALPMAVREEHVYVILRNLLSNARDAIRAHGPTGSICVEAEAAPDHIVVRVRDSGGGMSAKVQARIFQPFFSTKGAHGTGLGLGLSRKLARVYGGDLTFTSQEGQGTVFALRLPVRH